MGRVVRQEACRGTLSWVGENCSSDVLSVSVRRFSSFGIFQTVVQSTDSQTEREGKEATKMDRQTLNRGDSTTDCKQTGDVIDTHSRNKANTEPDIKRYKQTGINKFKQMDSETDVKTNTQHCVDNHKHNKKAESFSDCELIKEEKKEDKHVWFNYTSIQFTHFSLDVR